MYDSTGPSVGDGGVFPGSPGDRGGEVGDGEYARSLIVHELLRCSAELDGAGVVAAGAGDRRSGVGAR